MDFMSCTGTISGGTKLRCNGGNWVEITPYDAVIFTDLLQITPESILYVMTWGMGAILLPWSLGFVVGIAKTLITRA